MKILILKIFFLVQQVFIFLQNIQKHNLLIQKRFIMDSQAIDGQKEHKEEIDMYQMCGLIDWKIKKLKQKSIFLVGLSRVGKSTLFNYINGAVLTGVEGDFKPCYQVEINQAQAAITDPGSVSVTLYPFIVQRKDYTMSDMAGYMDSRTYAPVMGVSYVLTAAFEVVKQCQFVLVLSRDYFNTKQLYLAVQGFLNMFNYNEMGDKSKENLLKATTLVFVRANTTRQPVQKYTTFLSKLKDKLPMNEKRLTNKVGIIQILDYFSKNSQQIYLFDEAVPGDKAIPCTMQEEHFAQRKYFQLAQQNLTFKRKHNKNIYRLPFEEDFNNIADLSGKVELAKKLDTKMKSYRTVAQILRKFLEKAMKPENYFNKSLSFQEQFKLMDNFSNEFDVYTKLGYKFGEQCGLKNIFSNQQKKGLISGIKLALNVFQLYEEFKNQPSHQDLEEFMKKYTVHLIQIIRLFRNSFCSSYQEELIIQRFLFVAIRGCRQFSILYQIRDSGKSDMTMQLKDSFESILSDKPLQKIHEQFITQLAKNIDQVVKVISPEVIQIYKNYLNQISVQYPLISQRTQYKQIKIKILESNTHELSPEDSLVSNYDILMEHIRTVTEKINAMNEQDDQQLELYPQQYNFKFLHLLLKIGNSLLQIDRGNTPRDDKFYKYDISMVDDDQNYNKQIYIQFQAVLAIKIFTYVGCVESVCKAHQFILKNLSEDQFMEKIGYLKGLAKYLSKNGRVEEAITRYQKALQICVLKNKLANYAQIKKQITWLQKSQQRNNKVYFRSLREKKIIDPSDDTELINFLDELRDDYIKRYQNYKEGQAETRAKQAEKRENEENI